MMSKVRVTAKVAADRLGISYVIAAGLLSYLEDIGAATVVEKIKHPSGRGKPTNLFEVDENVTLSFAESESVAVAVEESVEEEAVEESVAVEDEDEVVC
jgi:predicted ArsR family transcriptional regulator